MSYVWTAPDFKQKIVTQLEQNAALAQLVPAVRVLTYSPSIDESITDLIAIGYEYSDDTEAIALNAATNPYDEVVDVRCGIRVVRPGAGREASEAAEERAVELLAAVSTEVQTNRPTVGNQTLKASVTDRRAEIFPYQTGKGVPVRVCVIEFSITYRARTSNS